MQTGITGLTIRALTGGIGSLAGPAVVHGNVTTEVSGTANAIVPASNEQAYVTTVNQRMASDTRPVNIALPVCTYLGLRA